MEIYLDNCATTRVDESSAQVALDLMLNDYGNPSSLHKKGFEAETRLTAAREQVAAAVGCSRDEIVFTSGGTEANNLAIFGAAAANKRSGNTIVTTEWEHSSVLEPMRELEKQGYKLKLVKPTQDGHICIDDIVQVVDDGTVLVSCMLVNSEVGGIADIANLVRKIRRINPKTLVHTDAVQAFGKLEFSAKKLDVDLLTLSAHKIHAPKGIGALYIKKGINIIPRVYGGSQERNLRTGTQAMPLIAAFGASAEVAAKNMPQNLEHITMIREHFVNKASQIGSLCINSPADATPYICNISVPKYRSEIMLHFLASKGIFVSSGSACGKGRPSHVLTAMNLPREQVDSALRVSFSKYTNISDIDAFFNALLQGIKEIKV